MRPVCAHAPSCHPPPLSSLLVSQRLFCPVRAMQGNILAQVRKQWLISLLPEALHMQWWGVI